ncbi:DUF2961 domain-containing protein [Polyangium spumosum]|uniref:DUF2961 domain-containing protein n=1 Tax=Polyangium spumosum TaxID=889282 RepID=A0A6N7Q382_9BACT|nr:DUF2961 domain-containing protein [Polyangium spumosum]MRG97075.1 DUF2961 domain-containing protein [Polyangium spumosum]
MGRSIHHVQPLSVVLAVAALAGCGDDPRPVVTLPPPGTREELADEAALAALADFRALPVFGEGRYLQTGSQDRLSGAPAPVDFVARGNRDMNHFVCPGQEASVSDNQLIRPIYDEPMCPEAYVKGVVLARFSGSGHLARLWLTASSLRDGLVANDEVLRIWVDDAPSPVVEEPLAAVIDGSAGEMFAPPFGDGPGNHLAWYYPVVFAKKIVIALDGLGPLEYYYHQASAVLSPEPAPRKAAPARLPARDQAIAALSSAAEGVIPGEPLVQPAPVNVMPGQTVTLADLSGPATIHAFSVELPEAQLAALRDVTLSVTWDDDVAPAILLPFSDLFAATLDPPENTSLALAGAREGGHVRLLLRLPMPFTKKVVFSATSAAASPVDFTLSIRGEEALPSEPFGRLHAVRSETVAPAPGPEHPLASVTGRGRWAGTCLMLEGHGIGDGSLFDEPLNFLEGDERAVLDGVTSVVGTGTEDYLNGAFYFESGPHASPFAQWWAAVVAPPSARASACRWHLLTDRIDFQESAEITLEIGPGLPETLDRYRSVTFLYR